MVSTWRVSADRMDQSLPEVIADRIWKGLERKKAYGFLHKPFEIWWPLADLNCGPIDYESYQVHFYEYAILGNYH
ncbi:hypothetical protein D3729_11990 [Vibrio parahaemolyticus]|nr:hypothetical protein [Vibrio parahaemolyticus]